MYEVLLGSYFLTEFALCKGSAAGLKIKGELMRFGMALVTLILGLGFSTKVGAESVDEVVVYIECTADGQPTSRGTGVLVSKDGHVLTAKHVVPDGYTCKGAVGNSTLPLRGLSRDPRSVNFDAILLRFTPNAGERFPRAKFCKLHERLKGTEIVATGFLDSRVGQPRPRPGVISTTIPNENALLETTAETSRGLSGGPVMLKGGITLLGIVAGAKLDPGTGLPVYYGVLPAELLADSFKLEQVAEGTAFSRCPMVKNRTKVILYPYQGLSGLDSTASYSDLEIFLSEKMRNIGANFSGIPEAKYLENLCVEKSSNKPKSLTEFIEEWREQNALLQMDGVITKSPTQSTENIAKSSIYFGDLTKVIPSEVIKSIHTDLLLDAHQYETISDAHSAATLFSLAVHAKGDGLSAAYYLRLAGLARETLNTIKAAGRESQDLKELRCALERLISDTTKQPTLTECQ